MYTEPPESLEQMSDQMAMPNSNSQWVNAKGMLHPPTYPDIREKPGGDNDLLIQDASI